MTRFPFELLNHAGWEMLFRDLFSNMCIIIALTFVYMQLRWKWLDHRSFSHAYLVDGVAGGILGIVLMYYSIQISDHMIIDLRYVAVVLVALFCGMKAAAISSLVVILARLSLGFDVGAYGGVPVVIFILAGSSFMNRTFMKAAGEVSKGLVMILYSNAIFSALMFTVIRENSLLLKTVSVYWVLATAGGLTALVFIKYIKQSHELFLKYEAESSTDFLTGLNNVRQFDLIWNEAMKNTMEREERLSLLVIDIDFFKKVNDTYGHAAGDLVLEELGKVLKANARSFDIVSRNGGEEFTVIMPDCPMSHAALIAERIRMAVENHGFPIGGDERISITISIGAVSYPETTTEPANMLHIADECLYRAKQTGRNRVCKAAYVKELVMRTD